MSKYVVVNRKNIAHNAKNPDNQRPVFSLHDGNNSIVYSNEINLYDKDGNYLGGFVYKPNKPKGCGATAWLNISKDAVVHVDNPQSYSEVCDLS